MRLAEFADSIWLEKYDASLDVLGRRNLTDTRKKDLTLKDLNRLKVIRAMRRVRELKMNSLRAVMYGGAGVEDLDRASDRLSLRKKQVDLRKAVVDLAGKTHDLAAKDTQHVSDAAKKFAVAQVRARKS